MKRAITVLLLLGGVIFLAWTGQKNATIEQKQVMETTTSKQDGIEVSQAAFTKSGMAVASLALKEGKATIPSSAIVWQEGKSWVYQQTDTRHYKRTVITITGRMSGTSYEVIGLEAGSIIVTTGAQLLLSFESGGAAQQGGDD